MRKHTFDLSYVLPSCLCSVSLFPSHIPFSYQYPVVISSLAGTVQHTQVIILYNNIKYY